MHASDKLNFSYFETRLIQEKEEIIKNIDSLKREVNGFGAEDEINDIEDMAELQINNTIDQTQIKRLESELAEVEAAINRIQAGSYGICEKSGDKIPIARLLANPTARTLVKA